MHRVNELYDFAKPVCKAIPIVALVHVHVNVYMQSTYLHFRFAIIHHKQKMNAALMEKVFKTFMKKFVNCKDLRLHTHLLTLQKVCLAYQHIA